VGRGRTTYPFWPKRYKGANIRGKKSLKRPEKGGSSRVDSGGGLIKERRAQKKNGGRRGNLCGELNKKEDRKKKTTAKCLSGTIRKGEKNRVKEL